MPRGVLGTLQPREKQGEHQLATRHYAAAVALRPGHKSAWRRYAAALHKAGDEEAAAVADAKTGD